MAMHNSADLTSAAGVVFTELKRLGIQTIRSGVGLLTKESRKVTLYSATASDQGDNLPLVGWAMLENHPVLSEMYDKWLINEDYFPILKGEILKSYYKQIKSNFVVITSYSIHYTKLYDNSEDVGKSVVKMFAELTALGVDESTRFGIGILNHDRNNFV